MGLRSVGQLQVPDGQPRRLGHPGSRVVEEQEHCLLTVSLRGIAVRHREQRVDLGLFEIGDRGWGGLLEWNRADLTAPFKMLGTAAADEASEGSNGGEALVAGLRRAATVVPEMGKEVEHAVDAEVEHGEALDRLAGAFGDEGHEQGECVAIAQLRVAGQVALAHEMFDEETP